MEGSEYYGKVFINMNKSEVQKRKLFIWKCKNCLFFFQVKIYSINCKINFKNKKKKRERKAKMLFVRMS